MLERIWLITLLLVHGWTAASAGVPAAAADGCGRADALAACEGCSCGAACGCVADAPRSDPVQNEATTPRPAEPLATPRSIAAAITPPRECLPVLSNQSIVRGVPVLQRLAFLCVWRT